MACGDSAAMESFFPLLQKNVLNTRRTREELRLAIMSWIETKYHRRRRQRRLGGLKTLNPECQPKPGQSRLPSLVFYLEPSHANAL